MKSVTVALVVVFNLSVVVLYSRNLATAANGWKSKAQPSAERSASETYVAPVEQHGSKPVAAADEGEPAAVKAERPLEARKVEAAPSSIASGDGKESIDGKEMVDAKEGKELQPVAQGERPLGLRLPLNRPTPETLPGAAGGRGILAAPNRANIDPPVVSPEAR